jgi:ribulose-bisphosphate carboxylase large chain
MVEYLEFLHLDYQPTKDDLVVTFQVEPARGISTKEAVARVASESSTGTWVKSLETETAGVKRRLHKISAKAFYIRGNIAKVAYPVELFEEGNMPQILSSIAGNIFGMKAVKNLRLEEISFPEKIVKSFKGPQFGLTGVRKFFGVKDRPLTATVPKPKVGLNYKEYAKVGYEAWIGGIDLLKDDENLTSQRFVDFEKRVVECSKMRELAEKETGEKKSYLVNVTAETQEMLRRAKIVKNLGFEYAMVDILTVGWGGVQTLRNECDKLNLIIHAHRAMHAAFDRYPRHGISMLAIAQIARVVGVDQLHTGTAGIGKLESGEGETEKINKFLKSRFFGLKQVFPVASGGVHPGVVPELIQKLGNDIIIQAGGGVHALGTRIGAAALRQAIDAAMQKIPLTEHAKKYPELRKALQTFGFVHPR